MSKLALYYNKTPLELKRRNSKDGYVLAIPEKMSEIAAMRSMPHEGMSQIGQ